MSKMTPKITIEKSKGQHIEMPITSERSKILTFRKRHWHLNDGIFQIRSTCFFDPGPPCRLKGRNFRGKKISQILAKFMNINSFFFPRKCLFAKIDSSKMFQNEWFTKIDSLKIFQKLMTCEYCSFCLIQFLLNQVFWRLSAILSFV